MVPGLDVIKFFKTETCQSAAMRQLGENLLRAATGSCSLQQAGATIAGASAESDKSLPPGRFARFVDGCNALMSSTTSAVSVAKTLMSRRFLPARWLSL